MTIRKLFIAALVSLGMTGAAAADTLLLVQGYLGSSLSWRSKAIGAILPSAGWADAGNLTPAPGGSIASSPGSASSKNRFYTLELPTEAPLMVQARVLAGYVALVRLRHGSERIILAGHSAGGVVARLFMVIQHAMPKARFQHDAKIDTLITIASPHLGTEVAELGLAAGNSPLGWFAPFFGGNTINRSRALYSDLSRERPTNILGWLNRRPHPRATYISIIRRNAGRSVVPEWSQDMNHVPALRGRARTVITPAGHGLRPADAYLLIGILRNRRTS